jgi:fatty acid desaturase
VPISKQAVPDQAVNAPELVQPVAHETADRVITGLVTAVPFLLLVVAAWQVWDEALHWRDLAILAVGYAITAMGITIGFHRLLTHRSFKTSATLRAIFAAIGSAAIEGPVISWVADHRKHHTFSDERGDPHSPHVGHGGGWRGTLRGLFHAHLGWLFVHTERGSKQRFASDLIEDPVVTTIDRTFFIWAVVGMLVPFAVGYAIGGTLVAGLTGSCGAGRSGSSWCTTSPTASTPCATCSEGADSPPRTSRATSSGSPSPPWVRPGTTTTMPSQPRRHTGWEAGSSIRRRQ